MIFTPEDLATLGRTVYGEARGEVGDKPKIAVAWVARNRYEHPGWWSREDGDGIEDDTISAVCRDPYQFSCWNKNDPNYPKISAMSDIDNDSFRQCMIAAYSVLAGFVDDPTQGCTHYFRVGSPEPRWARGVEPQVKIGNHVFYKGIA